MGTFSLPAASVEEPRNEPKRGGGRMVVLVSNAAVWLMVAAFGGLIWAINGGFSVAGLEAVALAFNREGEIFWQAAATWTFTLPVSLAGLPVAQPVVPWIGVVSASMLQIAIVYAQRRSVRLPTYIYYAAVVMSLYDLVTTFYGAGAIQWIADGGILVQGVITLFITFSFEATIGYLLR